MYPRAFCTVRYLAKFPAHQSQEGTLGQMSTPVPQHCTVSHRKCALSRKKSADIHRVTFSGLKRRRRHLVELAEVSGDPPQKLGVLTFLAFNTVRINKSLSLNYWQNLVKVTEHLPTLSSRTTTLTASASSGEWLTPEMYAFICKCLTNAPFRPTPFFCDLQD